ncbi:helix-turn-helix transcriptional regulator [Stenomitos frigidus]|uniref:Helix-turn-helix transcriptional regulator n=1 Tax=Stenomitos frigidus ULC18 TaxID=2107698 RepID=A0A2T1DUK9_9CYAN|nr:helix-turn-helix transcriptional regulator [Stenomitos frigidus]PSB24193.1 helix-turn-helix transcriptional regulator [Stenomitos frigidus ULC18]
MISRACTANNKVDLFQLQKARTALQTYAFEKNYEQIDLPQEVIKDLIDGVLILTEKRELIYANECARRILRQLNQERSLVNQIPEEVWHICQALIDSRHLFPNQYWLIESKVFIGNSIVFNVQARWLKLEDRDRPCLLLSIRDQCQSIKDIVNEESQKYGLTSREKEIWLLHRANYTYKQVALELCITPNTVKKHMKSIYSKQKAMLMLQEA